ncbi:MAG TPA: GNAT family N-acetyltransferase [Chloroflexaceae bacterium]|nr:GNAT family N-acetyltransferase [Chloroflexaceae bacterium]
MPTSMNQPIQRRLTAADVGAAAEVLARAFVHDPLWCYLFPEPGQRAALVLQAFRAFAPSLIADAVALGVGAPLEGVAVWSPPDKAPPQPGALLSPGLLTLAFGPFLAALPRAAPIFSRFEALQRRHAPEPHYYLSIVGVVPGAQGRGLASALIRPVLAQADARGLTAYTETMTPENVPLYQHYGFVVREEAPVAAGELRIWALQRPRLADSVAGRP